VRRGRAFLAAVGGALAAASLGGCTAFYWSKPGATPDQFAKDSQECEREAAPSPAAVGYGVIIQEVYRRCLQARGYARSKQYEPAPAGYHRGIE
jgi:hypothetical protein